MVHSILDSITPDRIRRDGFPHAIVENALPEGYYEELASTFPPLDRVAGDGQLKNNAAYRMLALDAIDNPGIPQIWRDFVAYHTSREFYDRFCDVWGADIEALHADIEDNFGVPLRDFSVGIRRTGKEDNAENLTDDIMLDCQFSYNSPVRSLSSVRGPHLDSPYKMFAALLYFRHPDDASTGGDFQIYRLREGASFKPRPAKIHPRNVELICTVPYRANTLVLFINSPAAIHGVTPRSVTETPRRYMNFLGECFRGRSSEYFVAGGGPIPGLWPALRRIWKRTKPKPAVPARPAS